MVENDQFPHQPLGFRNCWGADTCPSSDLSLSRNFFILSYLCFHFPSSLLELIHVCIPTFMAHSDIQITHKWRTSKENVFFLKIFLQIKRNPSRKQKLWNKQFYIFAVTKYLNNNLRVSRFCFKTYKSTSFWWTIEDMLSIVGKQVKKYVDARLSNGVYMQWLSAVKQFSCKSLSPGPGVNLNALLFCCCLLLL